MSGNQAYLDNTMLGETVIYCDTKSDKHPAMIQKVISDEVVNLLVFYEHGIIQSSFNITFNHNIEATPNTWYRRNKM